MGGAFLQDGAPEVRTPGFTTLLLLSDVLCRLVFFFLIGVRAGAGDKGRTLERAAAEPGAVLGAPLG